MEGPPQVVARLHRLQCRRRLLVRLRLVHTRAVEVLVEQRPQPLAAEARPRPPRVVARLRRWQRRLQLLMRFRLMHMLAVEVLVERRLRLEHMLAVDVLVERRFRTPAVEARLRPPRVVARFRRRRRWLLRRWPVQMLVVEALPVP